jgi:hypothetical protein
MDYVAGTIKLRLFENLHFRSIFGPWILLGDFFTMEEYSFNLF